MKPARRIETAKHYWKDADLDLPELRAMAAFR